MQYMISGFLQPIIRRYIFILFGCFFIAYSISPIWQQNIYVVHTALESVCIIISLSSFLLVWNTYEKTNPINHIIGLSFLAVAIFDILHTYYFFGVRALNQGYPDLSTRYWIIGRIIEAGVLCFVALGKSLNLPNKWFMLAIVIAGSTGIGAVIQFYPSLLPLMMTDEGLTTAKILLEYVVILITAISIYNLRDKLGCAGAVSHERIYMALLLIIPAELLFTLFKVVTSLYSTFGHLLKIACYYYLYKAIFVDAIIYPYKKLDLEKIILEQKNAELLRITAELHENQLKEQQTRDKMAQLDRLNLIGEMAASIGHEVRNPMTTVRGYLQYFRHKNDFSKYDEQINIMIEEIDRANAIITEFLGLAKGKPLSLKYDSLNNCIKSLQPLLQAEAFHRGHDIFFELNEIPEINFDEKEIRQVVLNLVKNGMEAMNHSGLITVRTAVVDSHVELIIRDTGSGISEEVMSKLGTPFVTTKDNGTGIGLAVCWRVVERHGAQIDISSGPTGTTVTIKFPLKYN